MASIHFSARSRPISRSQGESATAAAAYRARCELADERSGQQHDYSQKNRDVLFSGMYAPAKAPEWAKDRAHFWNRVEARENRKDSQLAREFTIALPAELTTEQNRMLVQDFVRENFVRRGYAADVNIHRPHPWGDQRNIHAHVMVPLRKFEGADWSRNKDHFVNGAPDVAELKRLRDAWEKLHNRHMERHGHEARISMQTLEAQGIDRTPEIHLGKAAAAMHRRGIETERSEKLREIRTSNAARELLKEAGFELKPLVVKFPELTRPPATLERELKQDQANDNKAPTRDERPVQDRQQPEPPALARLPDPAKQHREQEAAARAGATADRTPERDGKAHELASPAKVSEPVRQQQQEAAAKVITTLEKMREREDREERTERDRKRGAALTFNARELLQAVRSVFTTMGGQLAHIFGLDRDDVLGRGPQLAASPAPAMKPASERQPPPVRPAPQPRYVIVQQEPEPEATPQTYKIQVPAQQRPAAQVAREQPARANDGQQRPAAPPPKRESDHDREEREKREGIRAKERPRYIYDQRTPPRELSLELRPKRRRPDELGP